MSVATIKKNDLVIAVRGANSGKKGKVLQVLPIKGRVIVEGVNMIKKCLRKSQDNPQGGIVEKEGALAVSNVMLFCPKCDKGVTVSRVREEKRSVRKCKKCTHAFDA